MFSSSSVSVVCLLQPVILNIRITKSGDLLCEQGTRPIHQIYPPRLQSLHFSPQIALHLLLLLVDPLNFGLVRSSQILIFLAHFHKLSLELLICDSKFGFYFSQAYFSVTKVSTATAFSLN
jgi:hypothetical protein